VLVALYRNIWRHAASLLKWQCFWRVLTSDGAPTVTAKVFRSVYETIDVNTWLCIKLGHDYLLLSYLQFSIHYQSCRCLIGASRTSSQTLSR
jgi:hypothetical protein